MIKRFHMGLVIFENFFHIKKDRPLRAGPMWSGKAHDAYTVASSVTAARCLEA